MSASLTLKFGVAAAAFSCLFAGSVVAQQTQATRDARSSQSASDASADQNVGQSGRSSAQQSGQSAIQDSDAAAPASQRYTANFRGESARAGDNKVEKFLAACMLAQNKAEIELSQFAAQQSQNPQVKEFAQKMVRDHQQMVQQLQQVAGKQGQSARGTSATGSTESTRSSTNTNAAIEASRNGSDAANASNPSSEARDSDAGGTATIGATDLLSDRSDSETLGTSSGAATGRAGSSARTSESDTATARSLTGTTDSQASGAIQQLIQIDKQIVDRQMQATRQVLEQKEGAEFDKCFLGIAMNAHVNMNAALEVIGQQDLGQLSQLAQQAQPKVQQHLEHAKQLMKQLDDASATAGPPRSARQPSDTDSQR